MNDKRSHRAIIYVRLSHLTEESLSPERQESACRAYAAAKGWPVVEVVSDLDVSGSDRGKRLERPGLNRVRELWRPGDVVVFAKLDRLARNVVDFRTFADEAEAAGASLASVDESLDLTTPAGKFVATILAAFAEMEAATISQRVKAGVRSMRHARRFPGGRVPYGYRTIPHPNGAGRALEPDPTTAPVVREMADRVLSGQTAYLVSQWLNSEGIKSALGREWTISTVRDVLTGEAIAGRVAVDGDVLRDANGLPEVVWEPLVTATESAQLRAALLPRTKNGPQRRRATRLLSGMLTCAACGSTMRIRSKGAGKPPQYQCPRRSDGLTCPQGTSIKAEFAEEVVTQAFLDAVGEMPAVRLTEVVGDSSGVAVVRQELEDTAQAMLAPGADRLALAERMNTLEAHLRDLESLPREPEVVAERTGKTMAQEWEDADVVTQREWLRQAVESITVTGPTRKKTPDPARIVINWDETDTEG